MKIFITGLMLVFFTSCVPCLQDEDSLFKVGDLVEIPIDGRVGSVYIISKSYDCSRFQYLIMFKNDVISRNPYTIQRFQEDQVILYKK